MFGDIPVTHEEIATGALSADKVASFRGLRLTGFPPVHD